MDNYDPGGVEYGTVPFNLKPRGRCQGTHANNRWLQLVRLDSFTRTCLFAHADRSENKMRANIGGLASRVAMVVERCR